MIKVCRFTVLTQMGAIAPVLENFAVGRWIGRLRIIEIRRLSGF
jgi:hypothetical protein